MTYLALVRHLSSVDYCMTFRLNTEKNVSDIFGIGKISLRYEFLQELLKLKIEEDVFDIFGIG